MDNGGGTAGGVGLGSICLILTIVFIVLKCTGVIAWSWFWVFFPLILNVGFVLLIIIIALILYLFTRR